MPQSFLPKFVDMVRVTSSTQGTGPLVCGPAVQGYASFAEALSAGDQFYYSIQGIEKPAEREVGRGTMLANGTIARQPLRGALTSFTSGNKTISLVAASEWYGKLQDVSLAAERQGSAATRAALKALTAEPGMCRYLAEDGSEGMFVFKTGDFSALVAADPRGGVCVAPASAPDGAAGAWVRDFSGPVDVRWFGAVADCTSIGAGTDNAAAIKAAIAVCARIGHAKLFIPCGRYRLGSTLIFPQGIELAGEGWFENPGLAGGTTYNGLQAFDGTVLVFDANVAGMLFHAQTDNSNASAVAASFETLKLSSPEWKFKGARQSRISDMMLYGGGGTNVAAHGVELRTVAKLDNVRCDTFAGSGFHVDASTHTNTTPYGNASGSAFMNCHARFNGLHGFRVRGNDANAMMFATCDAALNGGAGFLDDGQLGNSYVNCHSATNNQTFGALTAQRTQALADWAGLSDQYAGSFVTTSPVGAHTLQGCYIEGGVGYKAQLVTPTVVTGGNLCSRVNWTASSNAVAYGYGVVGNVTTLQPPSGGVLTVEAGDFAVTRPSGIAALTVASGSGTYSNLQLRGGNSTANGLDILAGGGAAYLSSDALVLRNAAQSQTFATVGSGGVDLAGGRSYRIGGVQVVGARETGWVAATGPASKGAFAATSAGAVSATYVQTEAQASRDRIAASEARIVAIEGAMRSHGLIN